MVALNGFLFDLDGVIVDTAKFHYVAWKEIASEWGYSLTINDNERLKGVSRMESLKIVLELAGKNMDAVQKEAVADRKNRLYLQSVECLRAQDVLPGAKEFLLTLRNSGKRLALASASKNATRVLELLQILPLFDAVIDGTMIQKTKPDPEIFLKAAQALGLPAHQCVVFEDAQAGIDAAKAAGMIAVGIGEKDNLRGADVVISTFVGFRFESLQKDGIR